MPGDNASYNDSYDNSGVSSSHLSDTQCSYIEYRAKVQQITLSPGLRELIDTRLKLSLEDIFEQASLPQKKK